MGLPGLSFLGFAEDEQEKIVPKAKRIMTIVNRIAKFKAK